jgi:hypothetical protein
MCDDAMCTMMATELKGKPIPDGNLNQWAGCTKSWVQFDYDAYAKVDWWWTVDEQRQVAAYSGTCFELRWCW